MQTFRPDVRIELVRKNEVVGAVTPNSELVKITSNSSVFEFPTMKIESEDPGLSDLLMGFAKEERLRLWWDRSPNADGSFMLGCEVGFYRKDTEVHRKEGQEVLSIRAEGIHSAFKLALLELQGEKSFGDCTFGNLVRTLFDQAGVQCDLHIDEFLENKEFTALTRRTNVYRLFKEVCMFVGASVLFKPDNSVHIEPAHQRLRRLASVEPTTITEKDIISMSQSESL